MGSNVVPFGRRSLGAILPGTFRKVAETLGLRVDVELDSLAFSFHRCKRGGRWGWTTWLHLGRLTLMAPWVDEMPFPAHRREAVVWAVGFARRIGVEAREVTRRSRKPDLRLVHSAPSGGPNG